MGIKRGSGSTFNFGFRAFSCYYHNAGFPSKTKSIWIQWLPYSDSTKLLDRRAEYLPQPSNRTIAHCIWRSSLFRKDFNFRLRSLCCEFEETQKILDVIWKLFVGWIPSTGINSIANKHFFLWLLINIASWTKHKKAKQRKPCLQKYASPSAPNTRSSTIADKFRISYGFQWCQGLRFIAVICYRGSVAIRYLQKIRLQDSWFLLDSLKL